ncbi:MAG: hypothetical protein SFV23_26505 [Planctomycetaceae bacterium]|nr:hypothetical protein [Planctomycetaceae bacterium]
MHNSNSQRCSGLAIFANRTPFNSRNAARTANASPDIAARAMIARISLAVLPEVVEGIRGLQFHSRNDELFHTVPDNIDCPEVHVVQEERCVSDIDIVAPGRQFHCQELRRGWTKNANSGSIVNNREVQLPRRNPLAASFSQSPAQLRSSAT